MAATVLTKLAMTAGFPLIKGILEDKIGGRNAVLAASVMKAIAGRAGVAPQDLEETARDMPDVVASAMADVEAMTPQMISLYQAGIDHQFAFLQAELKKPTWTWAWRSLWMYLLGLLWLWNIVILHLLNAIMKWQLPTTDMTTLLGLTSLFMALYMGGHTLKEVWKSGGPAK